MADTIRRDNLRPRLSAFGRLVDFEVTRGPSAGPWSKEWPSKVKNAACGLSFRDQKRAVGSILDRTGKSIQGILVQGGLPCRIERGWFWYVFWAFVWRWRGRR